jgi:hypothetical protein
MCRKEPVKMQWFIDQENSTNSPITFKNGITYEKIKNHKCKLNYLMMILMNVIQDTVDYNL